MSGWLTLAAILVGSTAMLWLLKVRGSLLGLAAAALLFGATGYVLQGRPGLAGVSRTAADEPPPLALGGARHAFFGTFTPAERWLILADSYARSGDTMAAAQTVQSAVRAHPEDPELWVGLGNALVDHAHGLSAASRMAYDRAIALAPTSPAPHFFLGLSMMRSGDAAGALAQWQGILATAPADASWRPLVIEGAEVLQRAMQQPASATPPQP